MNSPVLSLQNVVKKYGDFTAVKDVSLSIPKEAIYGFLGPTCTGKAIILMKPSSGFIGFLGITPRLPPATA